VVLVGAANYDHATVRRVRTLADAKRIHWLGHVHDQDLLDELWANAAVYWHGHSVGGTNPGLLQALGAGAPTIALDTPFNREVIDHDDQLIDSNAVALGERISALLQSPALAQTFRDRGRRIVSTRYSWDSVCEAYETLLEELAASRAAVPARRRPDRRRDTPLRRAAEGGRIVVVVGPDGAGKSTLTRELRAKLAESLSEDVPAVNFREGIVDDLLRRSGVEGRSMDPTSTPVRSPIPATAKALALWLDLRFSARRWRARRGRSVTLVERYVYDFLLDPRRLGLSRVPWRLRSLAVQLSARPDAIVVCRAPADVLAGRKPELNEAEIARQYRVWEVLCGRLDAPILDVATIEPVDVDTLAKSVLEVIDA
jgi:hypothetical protein